MQYRCTTANRATVREKLDWTTLGLLNSGQRQQHVQHPLHRELGYLRLAIIYAICHQQRRVASQSQPCDELHALAVIWILPQLGEGVGTRIERSEYPFKEHSSTATGLL